MIAVVSYLLAAAIVAAVAGLAALAAAFVASLGRTCTRCGGPLDGPPGDASVCSSCWRSSQSVWVDQDLRS